jgi:hypothetical protein
MIGRNSPDQAHHGWALAGFAQSSSGSERNTGPDGGSGVEVYQSRASCSLRVAIGDGESREGQIH